MNFNEFREIEGVFRKIRYDGKYSGVPAKTMYLIAAFK